MSKEIVSSWSYLALPEPKAGTQGQGASSGGVLVCHTSFLESSQTRDQSAEVADAQWAHPASPPPPATPGTPAWGCVSGSVT